MIVITIVPHNYSILALYLSVLLSQTIVITLTLHHLKYQFEINIRYYNISQLHNIKLTFNNKPIIASVK